jgi:hypothetical protein
MDPFTRCPPTPPALSLRSVRVQAMQQASGTFWVLPAWEAESHLKQPDAENTVLSAIKGGQSPRGRGCRFGCRGTFLASQGSPPSQGLCGGHAHRQWRAQRVAERRAPSPDDLFKIPPCPADAAS